MARRYLTHQQLALELGTVRAPDTLGNHTMVVSLLANGDLRIVGSRKGAVVLKPHQTLGYDRGAVWVVPALESYEDPIRRVLAEAHVSQQVLQVSSSAVPFKLAFDAHPWHGDEPPWVLGPHQLNENVQGTRMSGRVLRGKAILVWEFADVMAWWPDAYPYRAIRTVTVRPQASRREVAEWLREALLGEGNYAAAQQRKLDAVFRYKEMARRTS